MSEKTQKEFSSYIESMTYQEPYMQKNMFLANQRAQHSALRPNMQQDHLIRTSSIIDQIYPSQEQAQVQGTEAFFEPICASPLPKEGIYEPQLAKFDSSQALFESEDELNYKQIVIDDQKQIYIQPVKNYAPTVETECLVPSEILKSKSYPLNSEDNKLFRQ